MARTDTLPFTANSFTGTRGLVSPAALVVKSLAASYRYGWAFDDTGAEGICSQAVIFPDECTGAGTLKCELQFSAASTSGNAAFNVSVEAVTPGDPLNLTTSEDFDTTNAGSRSIAGATIGGNLSLTIDLANKDNVASGDLFRLAVQRNVGIGSNATGDLTLWAVSIFEEI